MVRQFEELSPGAAEKIIDAQLIAPQRRLDKLADAEIRTASTAQGWGIFFAIGLIVFSIIFFWRGNSIAGGALIGPVILGVLSLILPESRKGKK